MNLQCVHLQKHFFFLLRVNWDMTFSDGVLSLYSFSLPIFLFFQMFPILRTLVYTYSPFSDCSIFFSQYFQDFQCGYVSFSLQFFKLGALQGLFKGSFMSISFKVSAFSLRVQSCLPLSPPDKFSTPTDPA